MPVSFKDLKKFFCKVLRHILLCGWYLSFTEQTADKVQASFEVCKCEQLEEVKNVPCASPSGGM